MSANIVARRTAYVNLLSLILVGCFHPPYNDFQPPAPSVKRATVGVGLGVITGSLIAGTAVGGAIGGAIGGTAGTAAEIYHAGKPAIIQDLRKNDIEFVQHGDTMVLIVPTDHYFEFNSPKLNELCFEGLNNIIKLLKLYKCSTVNVAGFTDNVGSYRHKKQLSQARAESMLTFLWANNIQARRLSAEGYADKFAIGDNHWIHGSAYNRRIEIQWENKAPNPQSSLPLNDGMK